MNRKVTLGLLVSCLLFLLAGGLGFAQEAAKKAPEKKPPAPTWVKLAGEVQVLRLWDTTGPKWPQIALLRLPETEYGKFEETPTEYVNGLKIFPKDVNEVFIGHVPRYAKPKAKGADDMTVVLFHEYPSRVFALSSEAEF
jgi:hypothetical protein